MVLEQLREVQTGELAAVVSIEDFRHAVANDCLLHCLHPEVGRQGVR